MPSGRGVVVNEFRPPDEKHKTTIVDTDAKSELKMLPLQYNQ